MNIQGGQLIQSNGNPIFPATQLTGPITAGNIKDWDGSAVLAGLGSTAGALANCGFARMSQIGRITQAASPGAAAGVFVSPDLIIPAQSLILAITTIMLTAWSGGATTFGIGNTQSPTTFTAAGAVSGTASVNTLISSAVGPTLLNWLNIGNQDEQLVFTSTNTGAGVAIAIVDYLQGINAATS
jgi:hypothetical protein